MYYLLKAKLKEIINNNNNDNNNNNNNNDNNDNNNSNRYQVKGFVKYFKLYKNFNLRLIPRINLRSKILNFLQRNHEISIFA